ncbi:hypothetical protein EJD97_001694 [Solanum chilense]|uniref:Uncharacterized protein n=1 Tax=Solanum chilense TaxID=4083 RepID=A0A6N2BZ52_SOLCI|nr:hypothetical protein EJD97_001694 [Solanum chilense]
MIGTSITEWDPEYVPPSISTPTEVARATLGMPLKVVFYIVTSSQIQEERTVTSTPFGSASGANQAEEPALNASSDEPTSSESFPAPQADVPTPVAEDSSRCDIGVPIWQFDTLYTSGGTVNRRLIRDEVNVVAPWRGTRVESHQMFENLVDTEVVMSMREDIDNILEMRGIELKTAPLELEEDTVLVTLFIAPTKIPPESRGRAQRLCFSRTIEGEDSRARKKEWTDLEASRRSSFIDKETLDEGSRHRYLGI